MKPVVAVVGGFLGAGKTTLIVKAARILQGRGVAVAAVLNDQGDDLVDTQLVRQNGMPADQVAGGCFCCRFPDLIEALERLGPHHPEVIFAEAVGSCIDIVATTLRPLLRDYGTNYLIAPLTVLVHEEPEGPDMRYLYENQVAEADLVVHRDVDVEGWLEQLLADGVQAGRQAISVDYERYRDAELALGWLNARAVVRARPAVGPAMVVGPLLDDLDRALSEAGIRIVHLKVMAQCESGYVKAGLTGNGGEPVAEGTLDASPAVEHEVLVNLRALGAPEEFREIVERSFAKVGGEWRALQAFRPAAPVPFQRL